MRRILVYLFLLILICFAIPVIFTSRYFEKKDTTAQIPLENNLESNYDYKTYANINLLHTSDNKIEQIKLDEYLYGVVSAEMPASFELEALKAQAVVARTYTIFKVINSKKKHGEADICDDSICCQAWISKEDRFSKWEKEDREKYWEKIVNAVNTTQGKMITFEGKPINAFFHSNSGGATEAPINVWGGSGYPYLQTVETSGENTYSQYSSKLTITKNEFKENTVK